MDANNASQAARHKSLSASTTSSDLVHSDYSSDVESSTEWTVADEKRLLRRVDLRLLPLLAMIYAFALIDRSNLGITRVVGMGDDLGLDIGNRFTVVSVIYFVPYTLLQLPSNLILKQLGPRIWLSFCVLAWGATELAMGFSKTWIHLAVCRAILGVFESGFFPALVLIITTWYKRHEVQKRLGAFYLCSVIAAGFGSILGYAISLLDGKRGIHGWSWIFIIEGAVTLALGIAFMAYIPGFPHSNTFLTPKETHIIMNRVELDRGDSVPDEMTFSILWKHLKDWTVWANGIMYMCATMPASVIGYFITIVLNGMGWGKTDSLLLSAPPYIFAAVSIMFFSWISDRTCRRALFLAVQALITMVGLFLTLYVRQPGGRYAGLFLCAAGASGNIPGILAYQSNNVVSHTKRVVTTACTIMFGGLGGVLATVTFREQDYPDYKPGMWVTIGLQFLLLALLASTTFHYNRLNHLSRAGKLDKPLEGQTGFFYTL